MGLDFSHGMNFAKDVRSKFNRQVHPSAKSGHFTMVVSFGRAKFKLDEDLVSIALEAVIGGLCGDLKVSIIRERVFSFCVSSKDVGFHILKLKRYSCPQFKCFFHLWGHGGPNWEREFFQWQKESDKEWTLVSPGKKRSQLGMLALQKEKPKSIVHSGVYRPKQLKFADDLSYTACVGYSRPKVSITGEENAESVVATTDVLVTGTSSSTVGPCTDTISSDMPLNHEKDNAFENMIDEMAFNFWTCSKCLSLGYVTNDCKNQIRCKACYRYGHIKKNCLISNRKGKQCWVPKRVGPGQINIDTTDSAAVSPPLTSSQSDSRHNPTSPNLQPPPPMAVYEIDPTQGWKKR
jgi:hypothetical protein